MIDLWNRAFPPPFVMDERLWRQNVEQGPPCEVLVETARGRPVGFAVVRRGPEGGWVEALGVDPEHRRRGIGSRLLRRAEGAIRTDRAAVPGWLRLGAGPAHFFPGLPHGLDRGFFERRGFRADWEAHDLLLAGGSPAALPAVVRSCRPADVPALLEFLDGEFPGRWARDTRRRLDRETGPADVLLAVPDGVVAGFCHVYHADSAVLGPSVFWREAMGTAWGGLGPVGVAAARRGTGLGRDLVAGAIAFLRSRGCRSIGVDWTGIPQFYRRFGFETWIRYTGMKREA